MPLEGSLKDLSLASLVQLNCQEMNEVRINLESFGKEGVIFCSGGNIVHASTDSSVGEEAVYELLRWKVGKFRVISNATSTERTIEKGWNSIIIEGLQRIDEGESSMDDKYSVLVNELKQLPNVSGVVIISRDGAVLAESVEGNPEKEGAVAVFLGNAADQIGEALVLGQFDWGVVSIGQERMQILEQPDFFIGLILTEKASPTIITTNVEEILYAWK